MAAFVKINQFVSDICRGVHNFTSDATSSITLALTNAANAPVATNTVLANLTVIAYTNLSSRVVLITSEGQTSGTEKLVLTDLVLTAAGGAVAAFRYLVMYNDDPTSPADPLIGWYDYGSDLTLADGETLTVDYSASNGVLQIV